MKQVKIAVHFKKKIKGAMQHQLYFDVDKNVMLDGEKINATYSFTNDINALALVITQYFPKILIVTPTFKIRYTNWDSLTEAEYMLNGGTLVSHQFIIDDQTYYAVAQDDEDISDMYIPIAKISLQPFDNPMLLEKEENKPEYRIQKAFVTNATARSAALIVCLYTSIQNGCNEIIPSEEDIDTFIDLFLDESNKFARLYKKAMSDFSAIEDVITGMSMTQRKILFGESAKIEVFNKLKRRIFHTKEDCPFMKQPYPKKKGHNLRNSGVFRGYDEDNDSFIYLHIDYLLRLGFRGCRKCCGINNEDTNLAWGDKENKLLSDLYEYMLCPVSLIAQVFQCEEDLIIHRLKEISIYSGDGNDDVLINLPNNGSS